MSEPQAPWLGWCREQGSVWQAVCSGRTHDDCLDALLAYRPRAKFAEKLVLRAGQYPERRKKPR